MNNIDKIKKALTVSNLNIQVIPMEESEYPGEEESFNFEGYNIGGVYIYTDLREISTICNTEKVPFWIVGYDIITSGGHWEPDDYDFAVYAEHRSFSDAVIEVIQLHIKWNLNNMFESLAYEECYQ